MDTNKPAAESTFLFYSDTEGKVKVQIILGDQTVWATQKTIAEIFDTDRSAITKHIQNIYEEGELMEEGTCAKIAQVQKEGNRLVNRDVTFYNLDAIIAVGYRVSSYKATKFRIWATGILKEYLIKGFALDDERLKQGNNLFGKDYFEELLTRIREIRASERKFYQKITDLYKDCSIDYDAKSPLTQAFYATVQNKLHYAITHKTAAEIVYTRASSAKPNMGLTSWKNSPTGKVLKADICVAKNYLTEAEIHDLDFLVNMYINRAELLARRKTPMKMKDWIEKLDSFLNFNEFDVLTNAGAISHKIAENFADKQYKKFRFIQDRNFVSDYDKVAASIEKTGELPKEEKEPDFKEMATYLKDKARKKRGGKP